MKSTRELERVDYLTAQKYLPRTMRRVCETDQAVTIDGAGKDQVVMLSRSQYESLIALTSCTPAGHQEAQVEPSQADAKDAT